MNTEEYRCEHCGWVAPIQEWWRDTTANSPYPIFRCPICSRPHSIFLDFDTQMELWEAII